MPPDAPAGTLSASRPESGADEAERHRPGGRQEAGLDDASTKRRIRRDRRWLA